MDTRAQATLTIAGTSVTVDAGPVIYRYADPARGEQRRPVAVVPAINALLDDEVEYARSDVAFTRKYNVRLHSATDTPRSVTVTLSAPGLTVDRLRAAAIRPRQTRIQRVVAQSTGTMR